jgi:CHAD domain-containing protein
MTLRLKESEPLQTGLRRLACECIDEALAALDESDGRDAAIHSVRKQCKQARALLHLFRFGLGRERTIESRYFRDIGRSLSVARDSKVALDVHAQLIERYGALIDPAVGAELRQGLIADARSLVLHESNAETTPNDGFRQRLMAVRSRVRSWTLSDEDDRTLRRGLKRAYRRARQAGQRACESGLPGDFHEARKRAKDYWYQLELVARRWPDAALTRVAPTRKLTELLGDAHDLEVYCDAIERAAIGRNPLAVEILSALAERRRRVLEREAVAVMGEVFAGKPRRFAAELQGPELKLRAAG